MTGRRRRRKQLLVDVQEKISYWKLKVEALNCPLWRTRLGRGFGPIIRQTADEMKTKLCFMI